ncbi:type I restriction-modification system subunit M [bacterium]|nr:type I restriction-modification system subunit M [bacterium]
MAIKKSQLYSSIWKSCDELRGGMDASQYKDYVLVLLFIKYISDKYADVTYAPITVPEGSSFKDMVALKGKPTIGDDINKKIIQKIEEANSSLGKIAVDFNDPTKLGSGKDMVERLTKLIAIFENPALDFSKNGAEGDDILGDAYEYLMKNFATQSGKSKGQFYTPAEVSRIIAKTIGIARTTNNTPTVYDPTCGSGSLLLKVADETDKNVKLCGQEMDNATAALARMNMILHDNPTSEIVRENTLSTPLFKNGTQLKTFDFVVANPPFSFKSWSNGIDPAHDVFGRFQDFGTPPAKNGDYAFILHIIRSLKTTGKGACIAPHGVLFRGNAESGIRTNIIRRGYIKGVIGLPANLFYGTGIPACIIVLDKENADNRKGIFMIDASKGFVKDGNKNRLRAQDIHKIVDVFTKQLEIPKYSRMVSVVEIEKNEFNLNIPRYIDSQEAEDIQDIEAHLKGDIPTQDIKDLQNYWSVYPTLKNFLFGKSKREGYSTLKIPQEEIKNTIFSHPEFTAYAKIMEATFTTWKEKNTILFKNLTIDLKPKEIIHGISEDILVAFSETRLIDKYDIYQHLMEYWAETMQDDMYLIAVDGWKAELSAVEGKKGETECDLVPKYLVINCYFAGEKQAIEDLQANLDTNSREIEELIEENSDEEGYFASFEKINKVNVTSRIKEIKNKPEDAEELKVMERYLALGEQESEAKKKIKEAEKALDTKVIAKYKTLTESEIQVLVVDDKWMGTLEEAVKGEMDRISQRLTGRIKELAERYATPLPTLISETETLTCKVDAHLKKMGFIW